MSFSPHQLPNLNEFPFLLRAKSQGAAPPDALFMPWSAWPPISLPPTARGRLVTDSNGNSYLLLTGLLPPGTNAASWLHWAAVDPAIILLYTVYQRGERYILVEQGYELLADVAAIAQYGEQWHNQMLLLRGKSPHLLINPTPPEVDPASLQTYRLPVRLATSPNQLPNNPLLSLQLVAKEGGLPSRADQVMAIVCGTSQTRQALRHWWQRQARDIQVQLAVYQDEYRSVVIRPARTQLPNLPYGELLVRAYHDAENHRQIFLPHTQQLWPQLPPEIIWQLLAVKEQENVLLFAATDELAPQKLVIKNEYLSTEMRAESGDLLP
jgi:hypothetical protein